MRHSIALSGLISSFIVGTALSTVVLADDLLQVNMTGNVTLKSNSKSAVRDARPAAVQDASKKLWRFMQNREEFGSKSRTFTQEQNDQMGAFLASDCSITDLDQDVDSKTYQLSWRFRFDCNTAHVNTNITQLNGAANAGAKASAEPTPILFLFFQQDDKKVYNFDDKKTVTSENKQTLSASDKATATLNVDNKVHAAVKSSEKESDTYGEKHGSVNEGVDKNASVKGRVTIDNSATASVQRDASLNQSKTNVSSGSTERIRDEAITAVSSADLFGNAFNGFFSSYKNFSPLDYADIKDCSDSAPSKEEVLKSLSGSAELVLTSDMQRRINAAARECGVRWVLIGKIKTSIPMNDRASDGFVTTVDVSAELKDVFKKPLPAKYSAVASNVPGRGKDDKQATNAATNNAANTLGQSVMNTISIQGVQ